VNGQISARVGRRDLMFLFDGLRIKQNSPQAI
jgi:hypothetical protein